MRLLRTLVPVGLLVALVAALVAACGGNSSSSPSADQSPSAGQPTGVAASAGALQARPVFARYDQSVPSNQQLGPTASKDLESAMKSHRCPSKAVQIQGMLMACDTGSTVFLLKDPIIAGGVTTAEARQIGHGKQWYVEVGFDQQGTSVLKAASTSMPGTELAFVLENQVLSANPIDSSMADGTVGLIGNFDEQQAKKVAQELKAG